MQSTGLSCQVRVEEIHEAGESRGIVDTQKKMVVIREEDERMKLDRVELLGSGEDPDDDGLQLIGGLEQKAALQGPTRHFDQGAAFGDEPQSPRHALKVALHSLVLSESGGTSSGPHCRLCCSSVVWRAIRSAGSQHEAIGLGRLPAHELRTRRRS
jgi:hypothetical protein